MDVKYVENKRDGGVKVKQLCVEENAVAYQVLRLRTNQHHIYTIGNKYSLRFHDQ